jgi:pyruvate kinase
MPSRRKTKIVATLGPASSAPDLVAALIAAGMNAARLNFSHGTQDDHARRVELVRTAQGEADVPIAVIADLQGPKLRVGDLPEPIEVETGTTVVVAGEDDARPDDIPVSPTVIGAVLRKGNDLLVDDGLIRLRVERMARGRAICRVLVGGSIGTHKGVNLPGVPIPVPSLTRKDLDDLDLALRLGVDYVALSFVRSASDVQKLKSRIADSGSKAHVIAKIEKAEAVEALDQILAVTDAVMVARGDLGVEIGVAAVPLLQKRIIMKALELGKPVITATQMLESMVHAPEPTRAEASDVANAVLDGTSAVMLSGETAIGEYPVETVAYVDRIVCAVEPSLGYRHEIPRAEDSPTVSQAVSNAACDVAEALSAKALVVPTYTGRTASAVARLRPRRAIIGLSHQPASLQRMALEWGITPVAITETDDVEDLMRRALVAARTSGIVEAGDRVVITAGTAVNLPGSTDTIKVDIA